MDSKKEYEKGSTFEQDDLANIPVILEPPNHVKEALELSEYIQDSKKNGEFEQLRFTAEKQETL